MKKMLLAAILSLTGCVMEADDEPDVSVTTHELGFENSTCFIKVNGSWDIGDRVGGYCTAWTSGVTKRCGSYGVYCD